MSDVHMIRLAGEQFNRISRRQLEDLEFTPSAIQHRLDHHRLVIDEQGVFALPPLLDDDRAHWMGATLTAPDTFLSVFDAAAAWDLGRYGRVDAVTVTRPGSGGPVRHGGLLVFRSSRLAGDTTQLGPIPITTVERTLVDLAPRISDKALARAVREGIRLERTSLVRIGNALGKHRGRRGTLKLGRVVSNYSGLPLERARSGAEVRAMLLFRDAGLTLPELNRRIAGEEADLAWLRPRRIIEIDGGPFHLDAGEDARKQAIWEAARWSVDRISSDDVYERPHLLLALHPERR